MNKILVVGATGNIGRFLVDELLKDGLSVKTLTRNPEKTNFPASVEVVKGDLRSREELINALIDVEKVFLVLPNILPDIFISAASEFKLKQIVFVSSYSVEIDWNSKNNLIAKHHIESEAIIKNSKIPYTFLRPAGFMTSAFQWLHSIKSQATVFLPFPDVQHAVIHPRDIALSAAAVFKSDIHLGKSYLLTGPELISFREQVRLISETTKKELKVIQPERDAVLRMMSQNMPLSFVESIIELLESKPKTINVSGNVKALTNTDGITFHTWALENKNIFLS
ncbi:MAG: NmrA family NAD(P)-binding protein [Leptospiraceae bacterium]|nr:NmrA family NAD(P)-binding protein [Leptospiraceae bacterium]